MELDHGTISGKRLVTVDHEVVVEEGMHIIDFGDQLKFSIAGQPAVLEVSTAGFDFDSALKVNDKVVPSIT